ncbi:MAG: cytochrome c oxidase assembly protein [Iamia sp.]
MVALAAPSAGSVLAPAIDPAFLLLSVLLGGGYAGLVRARSRRHPERPWPRGRTAAFVVGVAAILASTQLGLARYDTSLLSLHMVQHLLLGMVAPLLLALGAPITLALQGLPRGGQVALLRVLNHPVARAISHPLVAWSLFSLSLFALYFSPLFALSIRDDLVHTGVHLHFLAAGFLFCWSVLAVDVGQRRVGHAVRLLAVIMTVPFHAILGLALQGGSDMPLGEGVFTPLDASWGSTLTVDQEVAASALWGLGEVWGVVLVVIVAASWMRDEARGQAREDARLDAAAADVAAEV